MDNKWLWIGFGALVLVFVLARTRGGAQVIPPTPGPDTSEADLARYDFAGRGFEALTGLLGQRDEYARDVALGRMTLERDVMLGRYSVERDLGIAAAQERASISASESYYKSAILQAGVQRHAASQGTKQSWIDGLIALGMEYGDDIIGLITGGGKGSGPTSGYPTAYGVPTRVGSATYTRVGLPGGNPRFG